MAYRAEAMIPVEVGLSSPRRLQFNEVSNDELRRCELNFLDEKISTCIVLATYQRKMTRYYNAKVKEGPPGI